MLTGPDDLTSIDVVQDALARIQSRISERRASGDYPAGLEDELDRHYRQVSDTLHGTSAALRGATEAVHRVGATSGFAAERISYASRAPAGAVVHRVVGKATMRQTQGVLQQVQEFAAATRDALEACLDVLQDQSVHTHPRLERRLAYLVDKLADFESARGELASLEARVAAIEATLGSSSS
ncbi:MAG TPA: hypothetical protein VM282_09310 [Acidimicrobiales bacterium]|nr:hypothetical protein [Acidimicrobiales bacterium]